MDQHHVDYIPEKASAVRTTQGIQQGPGSSCSLQCSLSFFFFLFPFSFHTSSKPRTVGLLMSKSMCGCGCSIISSLMKRLGRTACCSDLFTSHTSEQLQRLATGCPPQPKVTMRQRPVTQPHLCLHFPPDQPAVYSLWLITRVQCRKHMGPDGRKPRV